MQGTPELLGANVVAVATAGDHLVLAEGDLWPKYCEVLGNLGSRHVFIFPIRGREGEPIGALIAGFERALEQPYQVWATSRQLADQLALGLSNVLLLEQLDLMRLGALTALARTIDASSHWTAGHSERVTAYALEIAKGFEFSASDLTRLRQGSLLHDIGKIGVPSSILDKAGPLTEPELVVMRSHPEIGARIVESVRAFQHLVPLVRHHHELLDGTGYPAGLRGDEIPDLVRILTVADVFDALTSNRPYREGLFPEEALALLDNGVGTKFDGRAVAALREMVGLERTPHTALAGQPGGIVPPPGDERQLMSINRRGQAA